MADPPETRWQGKSGLMYVYWVYPLATTFEAMPGNYVVAKQRAPGAFSAIYVGQTGNLFQRFDGHEKWGCFIDEGATHLCVHLNEQGEAVRLAEERDLIQGLAPPCNDQPVEDE